MLQPKLRQDITPAPDADPFFGPVVSELVRYLASIGMTAAATVMAVGCRQHGDHPPTCPSYLWFQ